jgi:hypothetical protein
MGCAPSLLVRWVREFAENLRLQAKKAHDHLEETGKPLDIIEMDEIYAQVKKGVQKSPYGLLILGGEARLLRLR